MENSSLSRNKTNQKNKEVFRTMNSLCKKVYQHVLVNQSFNTFYSIISDNGCLQQPTLAKNKAGLCFPYTLVSFLSQIM